MFLLEFFKSQNTCKHEHITPEQECGYCPDCGEFIQNEWYLVRCSCCGVKRKAMIRNGKVVPQDHFCHNCGENEVIIEKLDAINFIDIQYSALLKKVCKSETVNNFTQCWEEKTLNIPRLLPLFR